MDIDKRHEQEMREAFNVQMKALLKNADRFRKTDPVVRVGLESELALDSPGIAPGEMEPVRDAIVKCVADDIDVELGAAQVELRTPPLRLDTPGGFDVLKSVYRTRVNALETSAKRHGVSVLRVGANPFLPTLGTPRTNKPKYQMVPNFYNDHHDPRKNTLIGVGKRRIDIGDAAVVSLFQSFQVNLEARSLEDACDKMNRSFMLSPFLLALSANARFLQCADSGMQDTRVLSWAMSHDTRPIADTGARDVRVVSWEKSFDLRPSRGDRDGLRVGLPPRYFKDIRAYLERAGRFPFILHAPEAALAIAIGMTWLDCRVKFIGDSAIVELRSLSTQPTIDEELLLTLLFLGRLEDSQARRERLLPIAMVRKNRVTAMLHGTGRPMWIMNDRGEPQKLPFKDALRLELSRTKAGLERLGLASALNKDLLRDTLAKGNPSDRLATAIGAQKNDLITPDAMRTALLHTGMLRF